MKKIRIERTFKEFIDWSVFDIKNRLKEVYGETLPRELEQEVEYIVTETYKVTRNRFLNLGASLPQGW